MKNVVSVIAVLLLTGCSTVVGNTPSFQYCSNVKYMRIGNQIELEARCQLPVGDSGIPVPGIP